jgi:hypothetical protein
MKYLLNASVFITANNNYYGINFCPAFWDWLIINNTRNIVFSIQAVLAEIAKRRDVLFLWAEQQSDSLFVNEEDGKSQSYIVDIYDWAIIENYKEATIERFFIGADPYIISYAITNNYIVVTDETYSHSKRHLRIPNVCKHFGVKCIRPFEMLRNEGAKFILAPT